LQVEQSLRFVLTNPKFVTWIWLTFKM